MRKSLKFALRFVAVLAVVALIQVTLVAPSPTGNPYASALSNVSVGAAYAFPINCPNNSCGGKKGCRADHGFYCTTSGGGCATSKCL